MPLQMSRARADEEEYWHSSKFRAFTFDDEDDELSQVGADPGSAGAPRPGVRQPPAPAPAPGRPLRGRLSPGLGPALR